MSQTTGHIVCYFALYWMSLHIILEIPGCYMLSHELLNVIVGYLTNYWMLYVISQTTGYLCVLS